MKYGLRDSHIEQILFVLRNYPSIDRAILYGSRAKGNYREASDIDLTLLGDTLDLDLLHSIENALDELLLPYTIDLSIFHKIENTDLIEHIKRVGIVIYDRDNIINTSN